MRDRKTRLKWPSFWTELPGQVLLGSLVKTLAKNGWRVRWNHRVGAIEVYR
ncbi:MAG: hypothetical protein WAU60_17870 [Candidatus Competibacter denitrificans]|jgi:hypothetical protein